MVTQNEVQSPVFPAHAGMIQEILLVLAGRIGVPRTRGDDPASLRNFVLLVLCSPHTRG